jgi:DNA-binding SARP family transcriptional activator
MSATGVQADAEVLMTLVGPPCLRLKGCRHALERKDAALLAILALDGAAPRARLASLLWPDVGDTGARNSLRQRLLRLRRIAERDLVTGSDVLSLAPGVMHELESPAARLGDDPAALEGELLGDLDYADCRELGDWVDAARTRWRIARRDALATIAAALETQDRIASALRYVERLVSDEPTFEPAYRSLMRLHRRRGDRAAALSAYERCRTTLAQEPGDVPSAETRDLHLRILQGTDDRSPALAPRSIAVLRPPSLVGREREWSELLSAWHNAQVAVLIGEPGIGKSRLLTDFAAAHPHCLTIGSRPGDAQAAYALLSRLVRALLPYQPVDLPDWVREQVALLLSEKNAKQAVRWNPVRLQLALVQMFAAVQAAGLHAILLDDLQFGDAASLETITAACLDDGAGPLRWLMASRVSEVPPVMSSWMTATASDRVCTVALGPLDHAAVVALLSSLAIDGLDAARMAEPLLKHAGGNPMFLLETLRALIAPGVSSAWQAARVLPVPEHVSDLIGRRLTLLSPGALELAQVAALAGQDFDAALAGHVLQRDALDLADPWRELEAAQILGGIAFAHDLIQEATTRSVSVASGPAWHARIAEYLESHSGEPARIGEHWRAAQRWAAAGRAFSAAAALLRNKLRRAEEAALLEQADACFAQTGDDDARAELLLELFRAHWVRKYRRGIRESQALLQRVARTPRAKMWALISQAMLAFDERQDDQSLALISAAREAAEALGDDAGEDRPALHMLTWEAISHAQLNRPAKAMALAQRLATAVDPMPPEKTVGMAHYGLGYTFELCGHLQAGLERLQRAESMFVSLDEPALAADCQSMSTVPLYYLGRLRAATARITLGRRALAELNGGRAEPHTADVYIAWCWRECGLLGPALSLMLETFERAAGAGDANLQALCGSELASLYLVLGQPARARRYLEPARSSPKVHIRMDGLLVEAELARTLGQAPDTLLRAAQTLLPTCQRSERYRWRIDIERVRSLPAVEAAALMHGNYEQAMARQTWSMAAPSWALWIAALTGAGERVAAAAQARQLSQVLGQLDDEVERPPMSIYPVEYFLILHHAFVAAADIEAADAALRRGVEWIHDVALPHVPSEFRDSFLDRNAVNRAIVTMARRGARD